MQCFVALSFIFMGIWPKVSFPPPPDKSPKITPPSLRNRVNNLFPSSPTSGGRTQLFTLTEEPPERVMRYWISHQHGVGIQSTAAQNWDYKTYTYDTWLRHVFVVQRFGTSMMYYRYYNGEKIIGKTVPDTYHYATYKLAYLNIGHNPRNIGPTIFPKGYIKDWTIGGRY